MLNALTTAVASVLEPRVLLIILAASFYGIFVGAIPGLTATMAVALLVPLTFFLSDIEAVAAIVACVTCSIFAGDLPATLVRIPGTPASAAYTADAYELTRRGRHMESLSVSLVFSTIGGLFGGLVLACAAPQLARVATQFTSYEYFWLYLFGLTCAVIVSDESRWKGMFAMLLGLLFSTVGLATDYSVPRLTFGNDELLTGINFIPALIGLFGVSEVLRNALLLPTSEPTPQGTYFSSGTAQAVRFRWVKWRSPDGLRRSATTVSASGPTPTVTDAVPPPTGAGTDPRPYRAAFRMAWRRKWSLLRSSSIGAFIGMLPGAGADIAAWISYAVSKRCSAKPEEYGHGAIDGIGDASGANNAALGGAWIPALVFGIPGDSVTAIAIGVLLMKDITPGPTIFSMEANPKQATFVLAIFVTFLVANLVMFPIGWLAIRGASWLIQIPRRILLPLILMFCIVGSFAMNGSYFDVGVMLAMGLLGLLLERNRVPLGSVVLGMILGGELEHKFIQCLSKSSSLTAFMASPISLGLAVTLFALWLAPVVTAWRAATWKRGD